MLSENNKLSAIIIDDHPLARVAIRNLLENDDINVIAESGDGAEALQVIKEMQPDIVVVDIDIPVLSGIEVVEKLRRQQNSCIIVVVSAKNDRFYGKRSADAGANALVSKKKGMSNIVAAVKAARNGYSYFPFSLDSFVGKLTSEQEKLDSLSTQEIKVMRYILNGVDNMHIATEMNISSKTVSTYKSRLMEKLECKSLMELFNLSNRNKIG